MSIESYDVRPVHCSGCDILTFEPATRADGLYCASCAAEMDDAIAGAIDPVDPADVMVISGYWANLPKWKIEAIYKKNGDILVDIIPAGLDVFQPVDVTTYKFSIQEKNVRGEDVECVCFDEVDDE